MDTLSNCADNIVLIGFMGAGKSTVGRLLAARTGRFFLDADVLIETSCGKEVREIFEEEGESRFREFERRSAEWLAGCVKGSVISTGGGMPMVVQELRKIGTVIYLALPFEKIVQRIDAKERLHRPLFQEIQKTEKLFYERKRIYEEQADITIAADHPTEEVVEAILHAL